MQQDIKALGFQKIKNAFVGGVEEIVDIGGFVYIYFGSIVGIVAAGQIAFDVQPAAIAVVVHGYHQSVAGHVFGDEGIGQLLCGFVAFAGVVAIGFEGGGQSFGRINAVGVKLVLFAGQLVAHVAVAAVLPGHKAAQLQAVDEGFGGGYGCGFVFVYMQPADAGLWLATGLLKADAGAAELMGTAVGLAMGLKREQHDAGKKDGFHKGKVGRNFGTTEAREVARRGPEYFLTQRHKDAEELGKVFGLWILLGGRLYFVRVQLLESTTTNQKFKTTNPKLRIVDTCIALQMSRWLSGDTTRMPYNNCWYPNKDLQK